MGDHGSSNTAKVMEFEALEEQTVRQLRGKTLNDPDPLNGSGTQWDELAQRGDLFSSPSWLGVLRDGYGLDLRTRVVGSGPVRCGIAWARIDGYRGERLVSLPFSDYAIPPGDLSPAASLRLLEPLLDQGVPLTMKLLDSANVGALPAGIERVGEAAWHGAVVPESEDELWSQLKSGARQNIRKARRNGVEVTKTSSVEALRSFRTLHVSLRKQKYRMLAQPEQFFDAIHTHFGPDQYRVILGWVEGELAAGVVLLLHQRVAYYKFNASTAVGLRARANDMVMWEAMRQAQDWGCSSFDFGVSDLDQPGLIRYKLKYATIASTVGTYRANSRTPSFRSQLADSILRALTKAFTSERCPISITSWAGNRLYRHFC